jgi:predicted RNA binding protein YcfA (HicA-like mRNA interferase family)
MSKLPVISGSECAKALGKVGFLMSRQRGSHMILVRDNPRITVSIPCHDSLDRGTLRSIIRQSGLSVEEFVRLL